MKEQDIYENRYIGFIDILGFCDLLKNEDPKKIKRILEVFEKEKNENYRRREKYEVSNEVEISLFSDSLIISYPEKNGEKGKDNLFNLLMDIIFIQFDLAYEEIFVRGGIIKGALYHKGDVCFGQPLIDVEELEKLAKYPRVILSKEVMDAAIINNVEADSRYSLYNTFDSEAEDFYKILKRDVDGMWYLDFISQSCEFDDGDSYIAMLEKIKKKCGEALNRYEDDNIREKYLWMKNRLAETVKSKSLRIPV